MNTQPLDEILKQITPLPWMKSGARIRRDYLGNAGQVVAWVGMDGPSTEPEPNAAYLAHAANVLPALVEALRLLVNCPDYRHINTHEMDAAKFALARATSVPVNS